ncbi:MAG: ferrochelatase, partial [Comamonas sp.]|nr:ferrochelatase [Comamonas sp.]
SMEAREAFLEAGGQEFAYIPCLNDRTSHIDLLEQLVQQHVAGWVEGWVDMQQK